MTDVFTTWPAPAVSQPVRARVSVPGSKSLTNRLLVLAALAEAPSTLRAPLISRDTQLMLDAVIALGGAVEHDGDAVRITPIEGVPDAPAEVECGLAGTVMRFVPFASAAAGVSARFDGDAQARVRPMGTVLSALRELGVDVSAESESLPFTMTVDAVPRGGSIDIDASQSSQFVSGLLLAAPRFAEGLTVRHTGASLPSVPHIDMTVETLRAAGVTVDTPEPNVWRVHPGPIAPLDITVEPDLSNAATFLAAALVTGGEVAVPNWPDHTTQAGDEFRFIAEAFGGESEFIDGELTVRGPKQLQPVDLDLSSVGELTPVTAAVAAAAGGTSRITGIGHLRGHETDRLSALAAELSAFGVTVDEGEDSLTITGPPAPDAGSIADRGWNTYADHRMVMAGAVLGLVTPGLVINDPDTVSKTLPAFTRMWDEAFG